MCALTLCLFMAQAADVSTYSKQQLRHEASFIRPINFTQKLRICNAYPMTSTMDIYKDDEKINTEPLAYKACGEFVSSLKSDSNLDFKIDDNTIGSFTITTLPDTDVVLQLVIYRHDPFSTSVSFESHVFANLASPQVAVIDTYRGAGASDVRIEDLKSVEKDKERRSELLRYDSVVAVNPGHYEVSLVGKEGKRQAKKDLVALPRQSYIVMRVGVEAEEDTPYPQEVVVFPHSNVAELGAAASLEVPRFASVFAALATLFLAGRP